jgi:hypothetical protein
MLIIRPSVEAARHFSRVELRGEMRRSHYDRAHTTKENSGEIHMPSICTYEEDDEEEEKRRGYLLLL